ncbi:MAG: hypothetical protein BZY88_02845 [SAR202 cluster bacterium Io17-Chloro-G9]|nr:MAG: hypothetical protein BZY88_02845 [SAR202 cluster bacterium Io17-Chloro-G9]
MHIGVCRLSLYLPGVQSLKGKRQVARSLTSRIRNEFNVSVAEVEDNDLWQRLTLGVTCVSNDSKHANEVLSRVVAFVETVRGDLEVLDYDTEIISGV